MQPVVAISFLADRNVELDHLVSVVRLNFSEIPLDSRPSQHHSTAMKQQRKFMKHMRLWAFNDLVELSFDLENWHFWIKQYQDKHFYKQNWHILDLKFVALYCHIYSIIYNEKVVDDADSRNFPNNTSGFYHQRLWQKTGLVQSSNGERAETYHGKCRMQDCMETPENWD